MESKNPVITQKQLREVRIIEEFLHGVLLPLSAAVAQGATIELLGDNQDVVLDAATILAERRLIIPSSR